jgi:hypothetical protein
MSQGKKITSGGANRPEVTINREKTLTGILTTAGCAVCFLVALTFCHGTEQLLLVSIGGLLATGGVR